MSQSEELTKNKLGIEGSSEERAHGIGWKIYFIIFILYRLLSFFEQINPIGVIFGILHLVLSTTVLYSWIWARRIGWLANIRWLVKLWSIQFFIAPIALVIYGYFILTKGDSEAISWIIAIAIQYPGLYGVYRIAWKSHLLYKPEKEVVKK